MNQKVTVLIADDERSIRTGLKALVERMGHTVSAELEGDLFRVTVRWQTAK